MKINLLSILFSVFLFTSCSSNSQSIQEKSAQDEKSAETKAVDHDSLEQKSPLIINTSEFKREESFTRLKQKIESKDTLFIHVMIPLCDNKNQGIVPVPSHLGDGMDPNSNLYWGAMYGFKSYFKRSEWKLINSEKKVSEDILERVIFEKKLPSSSMVMIVADAYQGDRMKELLHDYFDAMAGKKKESYRALDSKFDTYSNADLIIFNGHNGLMDYKVDRVATEDSIVREAAVIGCISYEYFRPQFLAGFGYPILTTSNLMAPEAYVAEGLIDAWLELKTEEEIRMAVGRAYNKYQKCGIRGATNLFYSGF